MQTWVWLDLLADLQPRPTREIVQTQSITRRPLYCVCRHCHQFYTSGKTFIFVENLCILKQCFSHFDCNPLNRIYMFQAYNKKMQTTWNTYMNYLLTILTKISPKKCTQKDLTSYWRETEHCVLNLPYFSSLYISGTYCMRATPIYRISRSISGI